MRRFLELLLHYYTTVSVKIIRCSYLDYTPETRMMASMKRITTTTTRGQHPRRARPQHCIVTLLPAFQCLVVIIMFFSYKFEFLRPNSSIDYNVDIFPAATTSRASIDIDVDAEHVEIDTDNGNFQERISRSEYVGDVSRMDKLEDRDKANKEGDDQNENVDLHKQQQQQQQHKPELQAPQKKHAAKISGAHSVRRVNLKNTDKEETKRKKEKKYLVFFSHSGFSNQLLGVQRAGQLAYFTNRVLVLPPVLPHQRSTHWSELRYNFFGTEARMCPSNVKQKKEWTDFMYRMLLLNAVKAVNNTHQFPSWRALIDFDILRNETNDGLEVIDLPEFMTDICHGRTDLISFGKEKIYQYDGRCDDPRGKALPYNRMLERFHTNFHNNTDRIAYIGSGFNLKSTIPKQDPVKYVLDRAFTAFSPSVELSDLFNHLRSKLPTEYGGAHVRLPDDESWLSLSSRRRKKTLKVNKASESTINWDILHCPPAIDPNVIKVYDELMRKMKNRTTNSTSTTVSWFIGTSHKHAKGCFELYMKKAKLFDDGEALQNAKKNITVLTLSDLMENDPFALTMAEKIQTERSTLGLVLDQLLLSSATTLQTVSKDSFGSTFQGLINKRHSILKEGSNHF